ncbi:MAG: HlyC/CorC family transporter [Rhodocyclaceae bacterium]|nr:HlyC/CorC family transporter [Rhodocyclaceae bacterium]
MDVKKRRAWAAWVITGLCAAGGAMALAAEESGATAGPASAGASDVALLVAYVLLALLFSFLCSVAEAVLLSITPAFIAGLQETRPRRAALLKELKQERLDQSLAAILTLNTIAHTVGAIGSGSKATAVFGSAWFGVFSAVMTLLILFLSEIVPKTIGAVYWRSLAGVVARFVRALIVMMYPLIKVSELLTRMVSRGAHVSVFSREEFVAMAGVGEQSGHLNARESRIIRNLFRMNTLTARDVMTPRTVVIGLERGVTVAGAMDEISAHPFSRLPVYEEDLDRASGFVMRDDLLLAAAREALDTPVESLQRPLLRVPADMALEPLLDTFLERRLQMALVVGEWGGTEGLVTLEDVVETLLGMEIVDETDRVPDMQALARQQWTKRARALGIEVLPEAHATAAESETVRKPEA